MLPHQSGEAGSIPFPIGFKPAMPGNMKLPVAFMFIFRIWVFLYFAAIAGMAIAGIENLIEKSILHSSPFIFVFYLQWRHLFKSIIISF